MRANQLKAGAILNYVIIGLNTLTALLYTPYMLRCLGQNDYGVYSLVASIISYLTILDFGFGNAIIRYTAKFRAEGKKREQWEMFGMFLIVYSIIGCVAFLGGLALYFNVDSLFDRTMTEADLSAARSMMLLLSLNLAFTFPLSIFGSIITAYENFIFQRIVNIIRILLSTGVMIAVLALGYKAVALVVVQTVFNLLTLIIFYIYSRQKLHIHVILGKFDFKFFKEISTYSFWIFLNVIMDKIYWGTGQFVLGAISGTVAVAIFSVAVLLHGMYMTFSGAISSVLLPKITRMVSLNAGRKEISDIFISTGRLQFLILGIILSGFIVFGKPFIDMWAGKNYTESYYVTLIFFATLLIPLIQNTGIIILQARNEMKFRSLLYLAISLISLAFQIILAKQYGVIGCAIAIGGALILGQGLIMNIYYWKVQSINIGSFWIQILRMAVVPTAFTIVGLMMGRIFDFYSMESLIAGIAVFTVLYLPCMWFIGMNRYEKNLVRSPLQKIKAKLSH